MFRGLQVTIQSATNKLMIKQLMESPIKTGEESSSNTN